MHRSAAANGFSAQLLLDRNSTNSNDERYKKITSHALRFKVGTLWTYRFSAWMRGNAKLVGDVFSGVLYLGGRSGQQIIVWADHPTRFLVFCVLGGCGTNLQNLRPEAVQFNLYIDALGR
jgi:hypothetical protein